MKITFIMLTAALIAVVLATFLCAVAKVNGKRTLRNVSAMLVFMLDVALDAWKQLWAIGGNAHRLMANSELGVGTHDANITKLTDAAITVRHLLYKKGSDNDHIAVSGATDIPLGVVADEATAAELDVTVKLLGKGETKKMVANAAITAGVPVYAAASGKVAPTGSVRVGIARTASAADGDVIEVQDQVPTAANGYTAGQGGAVTQITSSSTGVTVNTLVGQITTVALTTAAAAEERFTVTNSSVAAADVIALSTTYAGNGTPMLSVVAVAAGSFDVVVTNVHASAALNALMVINFAVIKGTAA